MTKYLLKRLLRGLLSVVIVVIIVMALVYTYTDRERIFDGDMQIQKQQHNDRVVYKYKQWEKYGYLTNLTYADYLTMLVDKGEITTEVRSQVVNIGRTSEKDSELVKEYVNKFYSYCASNGYKAMRLDAVVVGTKIPNGGQQRLFAYKEYSTMHRTWTFFKNLIKVDTIHYVEDDDQLVGERGIKFTWYDPAYGGKKFSPAIIGNGTEHKYLLYFDNKFPFIHQNIVTIRLGTSFSINKGVDAFDTMTESQGSNLSSLVTYPTGYQEMSSDDLHAATFVADSLLNGGMFATERYTDNYTNVGTVKHSSSRVGFSFVIGILSSILAYMLGVPLGIMMARNKGKLLDKLGTIYIVFIIAVPSLAYIFIFRSLGMKMGLPGRFDIDSTSKLMYILPIISLALPAVAGLMNWLRRYMIDQQNSDYVKFARSGGLSEREIFNKHILKNAIIPLVHNIPGTILGAIVGAIITESIYSVPGTGKMLTDAITKFDNSVIIGLTMFYAVLSVVSLILGDILMSMVDPRISFSDKAR